ncbi:MAG: hypothetical protein GDA68_22625, partial [Nitrospira sp. CR2.1]|nr:hypothetical protein [Nitrospira sp. CR2.1]
MYKMLQSHHKTIHEALGRNPIHPFPARMAPGIALEALGNTKKSLRVLDPMMGSGTVLAVARSRGHRAIGIDMDPLAVLLSKVWTTTIDPDRARDKAIEVLGRAKTTFRDLKVKDAYPLKADEATKAFIRYWFDSYSRRQLAALSRTIGRVHDHDIRDVLWCSFSRLIISKQSGASLAMDLSHSRPHRVFDRAPTRPFNKFLSAIEMVTLNCPQHRRGPVGPTTKAQLGDARALSIANESIDLVLTSPPYLNAIDYIRCSKFSLVWMGYCLGELRQTRSDSIGSEHSSASARDDKGVRQIIKDLQLTPKLDDREYNVLCQYVFDMRNALSEVYRVLVRGGR